MLELALEIFGRKQPIEAHHIQWTKLLESPTNLGRIMG